MAEQSIHPSNHRKLPAVTTHTQYAFMFPKNRRFQSQNPECPQAFYNNQSCLSRRSTGFGYGKKSDFTQNKVESPGSTRYNYSSAIGKGKGKSFACSRDQSPNRSYIPLQLRANPGPGEYEDGLKPRGAFKQLLKTIEACYPYSPGNYFSSKYKSTKYGTIDSKAKRFPEIKLSPGPGEYFLDDTNKMSNGYVISNFTSRGSRLFDQEARFTDSHWKVNETPGPGRYDSGQKMI